MTSVLVTGAAGFIGTHLIQALLAGSDTVRVHGIDLKPMPVCLEGLVGLSWVTEDARSTRAFRYHDRYDVVVHLAGNPEVRASDDRPVETIDNNVCVTAHIYDQAMRHGVKRVVLASSSAVYGAARPPFSETATEVAGAVPTSLYGESKRMCEGVARFYATRHRLPSTVLRFFTVYGPGGSDTMAVGAFAKHLREGTPLRVFGSGDRNRRDFVHVDDVIRAIRLAIDHSTLYDVFNVGTGTTTSINELIAELGRALDAAPVEVQRLAEHPADVPETCADVAHAVRGLGFTARVTLREGLASLAEHV